MTFDAGSIDATFDVDLTPFQRGLDQARSEAKAFADERFSISVKVDADTTAAQAKIDKMRAQLNRNMRLDIDTSAADAKIATTNALLDKTQQKAKDTGAAFNPLLDTILLLGPAVVPLAAGLAGISTAAVGIGISGVLAFKGIEAEIKNNTALGRQFSAGLAVLNTGYTTLRTTAAKDALSPFQQTVTKLNSEVPVLNQFLLRTDPLVGSVASHLVGGLVAGLNDASPAIQTALGYTDKWAASFENWASGPGGTKFFDALQRDIPEVVDFLKNLFGSVANILTALGPLGHAELDVVTQILGVIAHAPTGVLTALALGFTVWRVAMLANNVAGLAATAMSARLTAANLAEAESANAAAVAEGRLAASRGAASDTGLLSGFGRLSAVGTVGGTIASTAGKLGLTALIGTLVSGVLKDSTGGTANPTTAGGAVTDTLHGVGTIGSDLFNPLKWSSTVQDVKKFTAGLQSALDVRDDQHSIDNYFKQVNASVASEINILKQQGPQYVAQYQAMISGGSTANYLASAGGKYATANYATLTRQSNQLNTSPVSSASIQSLSSYASALQKNIDAESKWLDLGGKHVQIAGLGAVADNTWNAALVASNGNYADAINLIRGHQVALSDDINAQKLAQQETVQQSTYMSDLEKKYGLTADQVTLFDTALGINGNTLGVTVSQLNNVETAFGKVETRLINGPPNVQAWLTAIAQINTTTPTITDKVNLFTAALTALQGNVLTEANTNLGAVSSLEQLSTALDQNKASIGANGQLLGQLTQTAHGYVVTQPQLTAGSLAVAQAMSTAASNAVGLAGSILANTGNAVEAAAAYNGMRAQLVSTATGMGLTGKQAEGLAKQIFGIPKDATTIAQLVQKNDMTGAIRTLTSAITGLTKQLWTATLNLGGNALGNLTAVQSTLNAITSHNYVATVDTNASPGSLKHNLTGNLPGGATGMLVTEGTTATADDVLVRVSKGEAIIAADQVTKHRALVNALVNKTRGFATGGYVAPSLLVGSSSSSSSAAAAAATAAASTISGFVGTLGGEFNTLSQSLKVDAATIESTTASIYSNMQAVVAAHYAPSSILTQLRAENTALVHEVQYRYNITNQLVAAQAALANVNQNIATEKTNVTNTALGAFDIGTSGSGYSYGILSSLTTATNNLTQFNSLQAQAKALGLDPRLLQQLSEEGPATAGKNLAAIVGGGASYVKQLNAQYSQFANAAGALGAATAQDVYGAQQAALLKQVAALTAKANSVQAVVASDISKIKATLANVQHDLEVAGRK